MKTIWIHAPNVHTGGAKILLLEIFNSINPENYRITLDSRFKFNFENSNLNLSFVNPNIFSRLLSEFALFRKSSKEDTVLCFGNLPPIFRLNAYVINYYQSPFIIQKRLLKFFNFKTKVRIFFERIWMKLFNGNVDLYVVQSETVLNEINKYCFQRVLVYPFIKKSRQLNLKDIEINKSGGLIYVSSGEPHKNHRTLIKAWIDLASMGIYPKLKLTLSPSANANLLNFIQSNTITYGLNIINLGNISHDEVILNYLESDALIFPSKYETFGLPLLEAFELGVPILASERDFVRDIVKPVQTFDPESSKSIARAVERFICGDNYRIPIHNGSSFVRELESNFAHHITN